MSFHVGQQVVCVDDATCDGKPAGLVVRGRVYTISKSLTNFRGQPGVWLAEVAHPEPWGGFLAYRFRPIQKTDISIFTSMLSPSPQTVREFTCDEPPRVKAGLVSNRHASPDTKPTGEALSHGVSGATTP